MDASSQHPPVGDIESSCSLLRSRVPDLLTIYAFGSRVQGTAGPQSDLDLAVLVAGYAEPLAWWTLSGDLADVAGCPVDLLDLRAASTVMQHQIITTGERWWAGNSQATLLGLPQSALDVFALLAQGGWIDAALADGLKRMVGFRDIAVHDDQSLQLPITVAIIQNHLGEFLRSSQAILLREAA